MKYNYGAICTKLCFLFLNNKYNYLEKIVLKYLRIERRRISEKYTIQWHCYLHHNVSSTSTSVVRMLTDCFYLSHKEQYILYFWTDYSRGTIDRKKTIISHPISHPPWGARTPSWPSSGPKGIPCKVWLHWLVRCRNA